MPIVYTDPNADVPPGVDFLDDAQADAWVAGCESDKPWRVPIRERFVELVSGLPDGANVQAARPFCALPNQPMHDG